MKYINIGPKMLNWFYLITIFFRIDHCLPQEFLHSIFCQFSFVPLFHISELFNLKLVSNYGWLKSLIFTVLENYFLFTCPCWMKIIYIYKIKMITNLKALSSTRKLLEFVKNWTIVKSGTKRQ